MFDFLDYLRESVVSRVDGSDEEAARRSSVPTWTSLMGLIKHLTTMESLWFQISFAGRDDTVPRDDVQTSDTVATAVAAYRNAIRTSNENVDRCNELELPVHEMRLHIHPLEGSGDGLCGFEQETKEPITVTHTEIIYRRRLAVLEHAQERGRDLPGLRHLEDPLLRVHGPSPGVQARISRHAQPSRHPRSTTRRHRHPDPGGARLPFARDGRRRRSEARTWWGGGWNDSAMKRYAPCAWEQ